MAIMHLSQSIETAQRIYFSPKSAKTFKSLNPDIYEIENSVHLDQLASEEPHFFHEICEFIMTNYFLLTVELDSLKIRLYSTSI